MQDIEWPRIKCFNSLAETLQKRQGMSVGGAWACHYMKRTDNAGIEWLNSSLDPSATARPSGCPVNQTGSLPRVG
ncbi:hypothetical protein [Mesorhizobium sp. M1E.F.Ca.ET.041.01.1.1]|uniref:hypothetical protein n=1 Tax=Mesorhizobium sp. M1E.F.Ca.ET.041.01.1.1 TaxID=2496759 RepID=UPI000FCAD1C7|nr:hypothetical protein [Mesorhizobium sp. M1E.F.Ca.ET.041.01.1.1]RUW26549.1 hypothetical protein EOA38_26965 [Mesorhizobium sp. M1E.F.Ca.ET.041.01.1.1]